MLINLERADSEVLTSLYGVENNNLKIIENRFCVTIFSRGNKLSIEGDPTSVKIASRVLQRLYDEINLIEITASELELIMKQEAGVQNPEYDGYVINTTLKAIRPYTDNQYRYIKCLANKDITIATGVAGTGKTYLAVAKAVEMFLNHKVKKIILTGPVVEAGEKLGFLPGDMKEKIDPYLQPMYDALYEMLPTDFVKRCFLTQQLQIAPLAFMRGRTLKDAFVILDEAQNTTATQLKMFLTRFGYGSRMVITGDVTQVDLPGNVNSGLLDAVKRLKQLEGIAITKFNVNDVSRHPLTAKIIDAYE